MAELAKDVKPVIETGKFIPEDKRWAKGLSQVEFEREWMRKYPRADAIPLAALWLYIIPAGSKGIDAIPPSYELKPDAVEVKKDIKIPLSNTELDKAKETKNGKNIIPQLNKQDSKKNK